MTQNIIQKEQICYIKIALFLGYSEKPTHDERNLINKLQSSFYLQETW